MTEENFEDDELASWQIKEQKRQERKKLFNAIGYVLMLISLIAFCYGNVKSAEQLQTSIDFMQSRK